jgi:AcrR family transcriptional regulator
VARYPKLKPGPGHSPGEVHQHQHARLFAAVIELVVEHGHDKLTVRRLSRLAGISSGAFYKHFDNLEECFAATYDFVMGRAAERAAEAARAPGNADWEQRVRAGVRRVLVDAAAEPDAARFALIEAFAGGPAMLPRIGSAFARFERMIAEVVPPLSPRTELSRAISVGMASGVARVVRTRLLSGRESELPMLVDGVSDWIISLCDVRARLLWHLGEDVSLRGPTGNGLATETSMRFPDGDPEHARILAAVVRLGTRDGYWGLTVPKIRAEAGVSRRSFDAHFEDICDCFVEAVETIATRAAGQAEEEATRAEDWGNGVFRATLAICNEIARDPVVAQLAFLDVFAPGREGFDCREHLLAEVASRLVSLAPADRRPSELAAEASVAAAWRLTYEEIAAGRRKSLPRRSLLIAYFILTPTIGASHAMGSICSGRG